MTDQPPAADNSAAPSVMDRMRGFRTLGASVLGATLVPIIVRQLKHVGIELTPDEQLGLATLLMGVLMAVMRLLTTTPVGRRLKPAAEELLGHLDLSLLARLVADELANRTAASATQRSTPNA